MGKPISLGHKDLEHTLGKVSDTREVFFDLRANILDMFTRDA